MGYTTTIEWADHTWSPWIGCTNVSPGCDHCYAEAWAARFRFVGWGNVPRRRSANWREPMKWNRQAPAAGTRRIVFPSLCDPFDNRVSDEWRAEF
jgi:protein gp37